MTTTPETARPSEASTAGGIAALARAHQRSLRIFLDGEFADGLGVAVDVENPYTQKPLVTVGSASEAQVEQAIRGARRAQDEGPWPSLSRRDRRMVLERFVDALDARHRLLTELQIGETGMFRLMCDYAGVEMPMRSWHVYAELAGRDWDEPSPPLAWMTPTGMRQAAGVVCMEPVGVVSAIVPFNFPFTVATHKVGAALAAGCSVILKASELTPLACAVMGEAAQEAELPPGVFQYLIGAEGVGRTMVGHDAVDAVSFTGSTRVGREIGAVAGRGVKRMVLELGGKSAAVVLEDANLDDTCVFLVAQYSHAGQGCALNTRFIVRDEIADEVVERVASLASLLSPGDPALSSTTHSPQIDARARDRVLGVVESTVAEGAELICGGGPVAGQPSGYWVEPTLFDHCPTQAGAAREEIFGPVLVVHRVRSDEEAVRVANDSPYGLWGSVHTADLVRGFELAKRIRSGAVGVNGMVSNDHAPFGGVKLSGVGREFGTWGVREFMEPKAISWHE